MHGIPELAKYNFRVACMLLFWGGKGVLMNSQFWWVKAYRFVYYYCLQICLLLLTGYGIPHRVSHLCEER